MKFRSLYPKPDQGEDNMKKIITAILTNANHKSLMLLVLLILSSVACGPSDSVKNKVRVNDAVVKAEGIRIVQNNGEAAGQVIFHLHVHIIPMRKDRQWAHYPQNRDAESLKDDAQKIRQFM